MIIIKTETDIRDAAMNCAKSCTMCFDWQSTERWVRLFANKRYDTIFEVQKCDCNNIMPKKYRKIFEDVFTKYTLKVIEQKQLEHIAKEKAERDKKKSTHRKGKR